MTTRWEHAGSGLGSHGVDVATHARIRAAMLEPGARLADVALRFKVSERTALMATSIPLPTARCPTCGGKVVLPCLKCSIDKRMRGEA